MNIKLTFINAPFMFAVEVYFKYIPTSLVKIQPVELKYEFYEHSILHSAYPCLTSPILCKFVIIDEYL